MKRLHIINERGQRKTQEGTMMVLVLYYQPVNMSSVAMSGILVLCKQVYEFLGRAAKDQQHGQPYRECDM